MPNIGDQLLALCDPTAEVLSDKDRIDRFVQVGHEVAVELAELDAFVAVHQYTIDANPTTSWPPDSVLAKAIARHEAREQVRRST
jgi:hypothetical protein